MPAPSSTGSVATHPNNRGWHDVWAGTVVVAQDVVPVVVYGVRRAQSCALAASVNEVCP
jgi:hypothetical protein